VGRAPCFFPRTQATSRTSRPTERDQHLKVATDVNVGADASKSQVLHRIEAAHPGASCGHRGRSSRGPPPRSLAVPGAWWTTSTCSTRGCPLRRRRAARRLARGLRLDADRPRARTYLVTPSIRRPRPSRRGKIGSRSSACCLEARPGRAGRLAVRRSQPYMRTNEHTATAGLASPRGTSPARAATGCSTLVVSGVTCDQGGSFDEHHTPRRPGLSR